MGKLTSHRDRCIPDVRNCDITRGLGEKRKEKKTLGETMRQSMKIRTKRFVW